MKKVLITFLLLLFSFSFAFAQEHSGKNGATSTKAIYPKHSVGLNVGFNYSFVNIDLIATNVRYGGVHASVGFEYKRTFNKWFGMIVNLGYDRYNLGVLTENLATAGEIRAVNPYAANFNFLFAFQRETPKGKSGLVPYLGVGPNFQFAGPLNFAPGIAVGAGLRYNFSFGLYLAIGVDYQFNINVMRYVLGLKPNTHQVRGKIAVGYRY